MMKNNWETICTSEANRHNSGFCVCSIETTCVLSVTVLQAIYCISCLLLAPSEAPSGVGGKALSATEAIVSWLPLSQSNIDGYQVSYYFYWGMFE